MCITHICTNTHTQPTSSFLPAWPQPQRQQLSIPCDPIYFPAGSVIHLLIHSTNLMSLRLRQAPLGGLMVSRRPVEDQNPSRETHSYRSAVEGVWSQAGQSSMTAAMATRRLAPHRVLFQGSPLFTHWPLTQPCELQLLSSSVLQTRKLKPRAIK